MTVRTAPVELPDLVTVPGRPFGIYIHVPFCATRCGYCDFNTYTPTELGGANPDGWLEALRAELGLAASRLGSPPAVDTVFVGGGTPSLLGGDGLQAVLDAVRAHFTLAADAEVTTEANPESTSPHFFEQLRTAGFTRVSLGMQSVAPHVLAVLDRVHSPGRALDAAREARGARLRPRQPRPHLRHAGGVRRRSAPLRRRGDRRRRRSCVRLRAGGRGRDGAGAPGAARRDRGPRRRRAGATLRVARRAAVGGRLRLVRGLQLEQAERRVQAQHRVLERRRMVGRRTGSAWLRRRDSLVECQASQRLCAIVGGRAAAGGRFRAARDRRDCTSRT